MKFNGIVPEKDVHPWQLFLFIILKAVQRRRLHNCIPAADTVGIKILNLIPVFVYQKCNKQALKSCLLF